MEKKGDFKYKYFGVPLTKKIENQDDGSIIVNGFFTSDNKDELGDIITRDATERALPKYRQWGNIRYMHLPKPVGRVSRIGVLDDLEWNEVEIRVIDPQAIFEVRSGLLTALSVGIYFSWNDFDIDEDGGWIINDYELVEISLVDHPANYDARLDNVKGYIQDMIRCKGTNEVLHSIEDIKQSIINNKGIKEEIDMEKDELNNKIDENKIEDNEETLNENIQVNVEEQDQVDDSIENTENIEDGEDVKDVENVEEDQLIEEDEVQIEDELMSNLNLDEEIASDAKEFFDSTDERLSLIEEAIAEASIQMEQAISDLSEQFKALPILVATAIGEELSKVNGYEYIRQGKMPETDLPGEIDEEDGEGDADEGGEVTLKEALRRYLESSNKN